MQRVMIIGCSGSGKSTLAKKLTGILGLPLVHLDVINWRDGWQTIPREEFDRQLEAEVAREKWIIDGNYNRTIARRMERCDTVIWLDYPRWVCLSGVIGRVLRHYGRTRSDMGGNCPERFDMEFLRFVWGFNRTHRPRYEQMLADVSGIRVYRFRSRREAGRFLRDLQGIGSKNGRKG